MNKHQSKQNLKLTSLIGMLISLVGVILCLLFGLPPVLKENRLRSAGKTATGTLTFTTWYQGSRGRTRIRYTYHVDGVSYVAEDVVRRGFARTREVGQALTITYLPSDPKISFTEASDEADAGCFWLVMGVVYAVFGMFALFHYWKQRKYGSFPK
jgi:hypothetical protein